MRAKTMVQPEREEPGKATAMIWARPKMTAKVQETSAVPWRPRIKNSTRIKRTPPAMRAMAMGATVWGRVRPHFLRVRAPAAVMAKARISFKK